MKKRFTLKDVCQNEASSDFATDSTMEVEFGHLNKKSRFSKEEQMGLWESVDMGRAAKEALKSSLSEKDKMKCKELLKKGKRARQLLFEDNVGLVGFAYKSYAYVPKQTTIEAEDILQYGYVGLLKAIDRYDYQRGVCFSTYAIPWIRQSMIRGIQAEKSVLRLPEQVDHDLRRVLSLKEKLCERLGREPKAEEIGKVLGMKTEKVKQLLAINPDVLFLNQSSENEEGSVCEMLTLIPDEKAEDPVQTLEEEELRAILAEALETCSERNRAILRMRYGFENGKIYTFEEISQKVNLSREGVRSVIKKELKRFGSSRYFMDKLAAYRNVA